MTTTSTTTATPVFYINPENGCTNCDTATPDVANRINEILGNADVLKRLKKEITGVVNNIVSYEDSATETLEFEVFAENRDHLVVEIDIFANVEKSESWGDYYTPAVKKSWAEDEEFWPKSVYFYDYENDVEYMFDFSDCAEIEWFDKHLTELQSTYYK